MACDLETTFSRATGSGSAGRLPRPIRLGTGVVIPAQAVSLLGATHTVLVQVQPGVFESREVVLSYQGPREAVVSRGLE